MDIATAIMVANVRAECETATIALDSAARALKTCGFDKTAAIFAQHAQSISHIEQFFIRQLIEAVTEAGKDGSD